VAFHAKDALGDDERAFMALLQAFFQVLHIVVAKTDTARVRPQRSIHQAGVKVMFAQNYLTLLGQCSYDSIIGLKSSSKADASLFTHKVRQLFFQLDVNV